MRSAFVVVFLIMISMLTACGGGGNSAQPSAITAPTYTASGKVTLDASGLAGVTVILSDPSGTNPITTTTQGNGTFSFTSVKNGSYIVSAALPGYTMSSTQSINVNSIR